MRSAITAFTLALLAPVTAHTQDSKAPFDLIPQISVVGRGEIKVSPDRATIQISVQTRAFMPGNRLPEALRTVKSSAFWSVPRKR